MGALSGVVTVVLLGKILNSRTASFEHACSGV